MELNVHGMSAEYRSIEGVSKKGEFLTNPQAASGQAAMRKDRNLGILVSAVFFVGGAYLLSESTANSQWYMDIYLIVGGTIAATGLMTGFWAIQQHLSMRRLERHVRGHH
jgi:hypothetical protein